MNCGGLPLNSGTFSRASRYRYMTTYKGDGWLGQRGTVVSPKVTLEKLLGERCISDF